MTRFSSLVAGDRGRCRTGSCLYCTWTKVAQRKSGAVANASRTPYYYPCGNGRSCFLPLLAWRHHVLQRRPRPRGAPPTLYVAAPILARILRGGTTGATSSRYCEFGRRERMGCWTVLGRVQRGEFCADSACYSRPIHSVCQH